MKENTRSIFYWSEIYYYFFSSFLVKFGHLCREFRFLTDHFPNEPNSPCTKQCRRSNRFFFFLRFKDQDTERSLNRETHSSFLQNFPARATETHAYRGPAQGEYLRGPLTASARAPPLPSFNARAIIKIPRRRRSPEGTSGHAPRLPLSTHSPFPLTDNNNFTPDLTSYLTNSSNKS